MTLSKTTPKLQNRINPLQKPREGLRETPSMPISNQPVTGPLPSPANCLCNSAASLESVVFISLSLPLSHDRPHHLNIFHSPPPAHPLPTLSPPDLLDTVQELTILPVTLAFPSLLGPSPNTYTLPGLKLAARGLYLACGCILLTCEVLFILYNIEELPILRTWVISDMKLANLVTLAQILTCNKPLVLSHSCVL